MSPFKTDSAKGENARREFTTIRLLLPFILGTVNCYLLETDGNYVLIDTGSSNRRRELEKGVESAGCRPGDLKLIVITHGDYDHTGNAAHIREMYETKIAMHYDDEGMVERGDMFWNRKMGNALFRIVASILFGFGKQERFEPDLYLEDGYDLSSYGLDARVFSIPGHSKGSIGILTAGGDLFCGDLFENRKTPVLSSIMDNPDEASASIEKLRGLGVNTVYPGHGDPFSMKQFLQNYWERGRARATVD